MIFPLIRLVLVSFFCPNYVKPFFVNKCAIITMIMSKISWKDIFMGFQLTVSENKHVLRDLSSTDQGNGSDMTFVAGANKINGEFWQKPYLSLSLKALKSSSHISAINRLEIFLIHVIT